MKILFLSHKFYPFVGGIEVNSEILAGYFQQFGAQIKLICWNEEKGDRLFPFEVIRNPQIRTLFKAFRWADVVYENNPSIRLSWPQIFFQRKHVVAIRTWISRTEGAITSVDYLKQVWVRRANAVIAVSQPIADSICPKATVIGNPYRSQLFRKINEIAKVKDFVFLGRLVSDKGADLAIELMQRLHRQPINSHLPHLTIIGDGPEMEKLKVLVRNYKLEKFIDFTGVLRGEELVNTLNQHKYLLAPSRWKEPFGNIALEGMACGCIPIVSDGGGLVDAIGDAGIIFERNNLENLVKQTVYLLTNPTKESQLRSNSDLHLRKHHPEVVALKYFQVIEQAIISH